MADLPKIEQAVGGVLEQEGVDIVDLQYLHENGRWVLRLFLDKPNGITLEDCEYLSNRIGGILDVTDLVPESYVLEVSSPGLDRLLKTEKDFTRFQGKRVQIWLKSPEQGRRHFIGSLKGYENNQVILAFGDQEIRLGVDRIEEARLHPELDI